MSAGRTILIVGASGRAAAASALRAGLQPFVIDLFADEDTTRMCPVLKCPLEDYPHGFIALAEQAPPGPWMHTGGLENYPEIIAAISGSRELRGNGSEVLSKVRDPFALAKILPMPAMRRGGEKLDPAKRWLQKPFRCSGGFGIAELPLSASERGPGGEVYVQELVQGLPCSAVYLFCNTARPELIGVCSQLIGAPWLNAPPYRYCGNIGPLVGDSALTIQLARIGETLQPSGLRGLVGVDFMRLNDGILALEVNPRYTASVELYERASGRSLLLEHIRSFETSPPSPLSQAGMGDEKIHGKAILYADHTFEVPVDHPWRGPTFADIPCVGSVIPEGDPVVTLFASADTESECRERLQDLARKSAPP